MKYTDCTCNVSRLIFGLLLLLIPVGVHLLVGLLVIDDLVKSLLLQVKYTVSLDFLSLYQSFNVQCAYS